MIFITYADPIERDPAPIFFDKEVQKCLRTLTTVDYNKVFRVRKDGHKLQPPQYKFMTQEDVEEARRTAENKAKKYLQMPPVVKPRTEISEVLDEDVALKDHDTAKYVFTDITLDLKDRERFVVTREPDGTLRQATWEERERMVQIFDPKPLKELRKPKMFEGQYLEVCTSLLL